MLPGFTNEEKITLYGISGGIPEYLSRIDNNLSLAKNIEELFFNPSGRLFEEPSNLLKQELKIPQTYNGIIAAIASGSSRLNEIAAKVGIETSQCSNMLAALAGLGIIKKECPVTNPGSKKTIYLLADMMFRFWYRFVQPDLSRISMGLGKEVCKEIFSGKIETHTGYVFEECAKQFLVQELSRKKFHFKSLGRWWGSNPAEHREEEIDLLAFDENNAIFGECKWRNTRTGLDTLDELVRRSELLPRFTNKQYILFSKSGFTAGIKNMAAKRKDLFLIHLEDMF
ncbi:MAG: ATP-binding protein [Spirochaetales bacterium]|jgi:AAA+ ATPase superfamily predicted ATPase|nr:ATP-binding protein [Spirochaetales bacterium]